MRQIVAERYGYRKVMMCALVYMSCIFFLHFFAQSLPMLLAAQILVGVPLYIRVIPCPQIRLKDVEKLPASFT